MKYCVFGDLSGWSTPFEHALKKLDVNFKSFTIPDNLTIIQVGDLIHKGPDSAHNLNLAYELKTHNPDNYIQLIGNHEAQYLNGPTFWHKQITKTTQEMLQIMKQENMIQNAYAIPGKTTASQKNKHNDILITHAGLTYQLYKKLNKPKTATDAANKLNNPNTPLQQEIEKAGAMLNEKTNPGIYWAEIGSELLKSWEPDTRKCPFDQIHGHTTPIWWAPKTWSRNVSKKAQKNAKINYKTRHATLTLNTTKFVSTDPGWGTHGCGNLHPYKIETTRQP